MIPTSVVDYDIVPRSPCSVAVNNPMFASKLALATLRDSGHYGFIRFSGEDILRSAHGEFDVGLVEGMDGTLVIRDFSGQPELARKKVESQLAGLENLRLETHHDCIPRRDVALYGAGN